MKNLISRISVLAASALVIVGCEAVDPSDVVNPNLSEAALIGQPNSADAWGSGLERQMALVSQETHHIAEIVSDNYVNTQTFFNQFLDGLRIDYQDADLNAQAFDIARLREMANYGLNEVLPNDPNGDAENTSTFQFYLGVAHMYSAMYYRALPGSEAGPLLSRAQHLDAAIAAFNASNAASANVGALIGVARCQYLKGDATAAEAAADAAIAADAGGGHVSYINFDAQNGPTNTIQDALYDRGSFDDLQPLPTLDFLDPKYAFISAIEDSKIALLKIEEAHLIKAEARSAAGDDPGAIAVMTDVINLVATRPTRDINDNVEQRTQRNEGSRPDSTDITVNGRAGLVLYRGGAPVTIPSISGTSYTAGDLAGLTGDGLLTALYHMRQEIFIGEGIRSMDMGITFVMSENELLLNSNVSASDVEADIPSFYSGIDVDAITYDPAARTCTVDNDINAIIVANKTSNYVCPFH